MTQHKHSCEAVNLIKSLFRLELVGGELQELEIQGETASFVTHNRGTP